MIVERIEVDGDTIFVVQIVAICDSRANGCRILRIRDDAEINRILRIKDASFRAFISRPTVDRLILMKAGESSSLRPRWIR